MPPPKNIPVPENLPPPKNLPPPENMFPHKNMLPPFELGFLFLENLRKERFCRKLIFEQMCHHQGSEKTFRIQFLVNKSKSIHF